MLNLHVYKYDEDRTSQQKLKKAVTWLRKVTNQLNYGILVKNEDDHTKKCPRANLKETIAKALNSKDRQDWKYIQKLNNQDFYDFFNHKTTLFFDGAAYSKQKRSLFVLDIDCHRWGDIVGALAYAEYLKQTYFPNMYYEVSTGGNGVHCYLILEKQSYHPVFLNKQLKQLNHFLREDLEVSGYGLRVQDIEVKGTFPDVVYDNNGKVKEYINGQQVKFPRNVEKFEEWQNTTVLTGMQLIEFVKNHQVEVEEDEPEEENLVLVKNRTMPKQHGSLGFNLFSEDDLNNEHVLRTATTLLEGHKLETSSNHIVEPIHLHDWLVVQKFCFNNPNDDGGNPTKRHKKLHDLLYGYGKVETAWNPNRFTAIRNYLSSLGLIVWINENYEIGFKNDKGEYIKGKAAKWSISQELMARLATNKERDQEQKAKWQEMKHSADKNGCQSSQEGGRERTFIITDLNSFVSSLTKLPFSKTIRPTLGYQDHHLLLNPDELSQFVIPLTLAA